MKLNLSKLQLDFFEEHPNLLKLSRRFDRKKKVGRAIIISALCIHMINFAILQNFLFGIIMLIIPLLILVTIGSSNFVSEFDNVKSGYIQKLLDDIENSKLKFEDSVVEMNEKDIDELGFLKSNIAPPLFPIRRNYISGSYKNVNVKIGELDFRHPIHKNARMFLWEPSTVLTFDYATNEESAKLSLFVKHSVAYRDMYTTSGFDRSIQYKKNIVDLSGIKIETTIRNIDLKYLTLTTDESLAKNILNEKLKFSLNLYNKWAYKMEGITRETGGRFLTVYKGKITILIYRQRFMNVRTDSIFEVYDKEIRSILELIDIFIFPDFNSDNIE